MTLVVAKKFGDSILICSDTMITDRDAGRENSIPGRLKVIILNRTLTVAYSGHSDPALEAIRHANSLLPCATAIIHESLREATRSTQHEIEFIVASHIPKPDLRKIRAGNISGCLDEAAMGNLVLWSGVRELVSGAQKQDLAEWRFAFLRAFTDVRSNFGDGVGGIPIIAEAYPDGHRYKWYSYNFNWKGFTLVPGLTIYEDAADSLTGEWSFHISVIVPDKIGIGALAVELPQAHTGYVYYPLYFDDPRKIKILGESKPWTDHQAEMHDTLRVALKECVK